MAPIEASCMICLLDWTEPISRVKPCVAHGVRAE